MQYNFITSFKNINYNILTIKIQLPKLITKTHYQNIITKNTTTKINIIISNYI